MGGLPTGIGPRGGCTGGDIPYGFEIDPDGPKGKLREHAGEQQVIALAREWSNEGLTLKAIAERLYKRGVRPRPLPPGTKRLPRKPGRRVFHPKQISRMLKP